MSLKRVVFDKSGYASEANSRVEDHSVICCIKSKTENKEKNMHATPFGVVETHHARVFSLKAAECYEKCSQGIFKIYSDVLLNTIFGCHRFFPLTAAL